MEPRWLTVPIVEALHRQSAAASGGAVGVRDIGLLASAVARAENLYAYESERSLHVLAAAYGFGIVRNHPFVDGNKRTGLLAAVAFLGLNGIQFRPREAEAFDIVMALAAGKRDEASLAQWIADFSVGL